MQHALKNNVASLERAAATDRLAAAKIDLKTARINAQLQKTNRAVAQRALTDRQIKIFREELAGANFAIGICAAPDDYEAFAFMIDMEQVLTLAGQRVEMVGDCGLGVATAPGTRAGVMLYVPPGGDGKKDPLYRAVKRAGLLTVFSRITFREELKDRHLIAIARRAPPAKQDLVGPDKTE